MAKQSSAQQQANDQSNKLINLQAQQLAAQVANWAAQLDFQKERLRLLELPEMQGKLQVDIDRLAFDKAQATWENAFKEASITGTYQGQPTTEWLTQQAQLTGVLDGKQTLQGKLTDAQIGQMNEQMRLANQEFLANTTGYINGQPTFDREKFQAGQATDAWKFLATLTGPSNAFKQARAIASMPGGMSDLMDQWAGKYATPGFTSVGSGGRADLGGLVGMPGYNFGGSVGPPVYSPPPAGGWGSPAAPIYGPAPTSAYTGGDQPAQGTIPQPGGGAAAPTAPVTAPATPTPGTTQPRRLDENSPEYADIQARLNAGQITRTRAAQEWDALLRTNNQPTPGIPDYGEGANDPLPIPFTLTVGAKPPATAPGQPVDVVNPTPGDPNQPPIHEPGFGGGGTGMVPPGWDNPANPTPVTVEGWPADSSAGSFKSSQPGYWTMGANGQWTFNAPPSGSSTDSASGFQAQSYSYQPAGVQAPVHQWNYSPTLTGSMQVYPPGVASPHETPDISTPHAVSPSTASNYYQYGGVATQTPDPGTYSGPLLPNQINAKNYAKSYQYQKDLGWAQYEDQGWDKGLAQEAFEKSLPSFSGPKVGSFAF